MIKTINTAAGTTIRTAIGLITARVIAGSEEEMKPTRSGITKAITTMVSHIMAATILTPLIQIQMLRGQMTMAQTPVADVRAVAMAAITGVAMVAMVTMAQGIPLCPTLRIAGKQL